MSLSSRGGFGRLIAGVSGLVLVPTSVVWANPSDATYRLVFADEFNGSTLDTSKWSAASPGWTMPNSLSTASADQVSIANGMMTMNAVRTGANTFSSGSISSYQKYNFAGGYVEARIQLPTTPGSWPAFWGLYNGWPPEMDIMEYPLTTDGGTTGYANNAYHTAFHYTNPSGSAAAGAGKVTTGSNLAGTWRTFAADWTSGTSVRFLLDGVQVSSFNSSEVAEMANMYMILDYAVGGWPGTPSTSQWAIGASDQTNVDWVRVWQRNASNDAASTWAVNGGGAFATTANWTGTGGVPRYGNQTAVFGRVGTAATAAITLTPWHVFGGITFDGNGTGTTAYTLGTSASQIQLASTAAGGVTVQATANSTVSQNINARVELWNNTTFKNDMTAGQTLNLNSQISGAGLLSVSGVGTTTLNTTNTYTGGTAIGTNQEAAVLRANADGALGTAGVVLGAAGNATTARLEIAGGRTLANAIDFRGRNNATVGIQSVVGNNTLSGTITANSGGGTFAIQSDADTLTLNGATGGGVAITAGSGNRTFTLQGAGNGVVSGRVQNGAGVVGIAKAGAGTWTLSGANTYTGATTVAGGRLVLTNSGVMAGTTVAAGATLSGRGNLANNAAVGINGTLDLADGAINTLSTTSVLGLTNATLSLDLGNGTNADKLTAIGAATVNGTNTVNVSAATGQSISNGGAYTLITAAGGLNAANFVIGTKPASLGFYNFSLSTPTSSALVLTATGNATPATAYWTGAGSAAVVDGTNGWGSGATVNTSNWSTDAAGTVDAQQVPGSITNVVFNAANAPSGSGTLATQLDSNYAVNGLTFDVPVGSGVTAVTLGTNGNSLTLGGGGLTLAAASNADATVSGTGGIKLAGSQTWSNQSDLRQFTIGTGVSPLAGNATLTVQGTGTAGVRFTGVLADSAAGVLSTVFNQATTLTLLAQNTYTGTTTINGAAVDISPTGKIAGDVVINGGVLRDTSATDGIADTATLTVNAGGTFDLRGTNGVIGSETIARLAGTGTLTRTTAGTGALTVGSSNASSAFAGSIQNGNGLFSLTKIGNGTLTLSGTSTYTGGTTIADQGGDLRVTSANALGNGNLTIGTGGSEPTGTLQISANTALVGVPTILLSSRSLTTLGGAATIENVSGNNAIAANLNINNTGGNAVNILSTAGTLTLSGSLSSTGLTSARGFNFYGSGNGVVSGVISNGTSQPTFVQKDGSGAWTLGGNNAFTGGTTVNAGTLTLTGNNNFGAGGVTVNGGTAVLTGSNAYTGGTTVSNGVVVMGSGFALGSASSVINLGTNGTLFVDTPGNDRAYNINVGSNNGSMTIVSGNSLNTAGLNHTLGTLSIGINDTLNVTAKAGITGSPAITLGAVTLSSGVGAGSTTFNPTSASLRLGAITTSTNSAKTVVLDGTATGNAVNGAITNGSNVLTLVKSNASTWTLAAASSFTGGTTINDNGGALLVTHGSALGTGPLTIGNGGSNKTGTLQLAGNINLAGVSAINIAGRNLSTAAGTATIENVSGNNTITTGLTFNNFGGNAANIASTAGQLTLAGSVTAATVTGPRGFNFYGDGNGVVSGAISNGSAAVFVQKSGTGVWSLTGANSYTGVTTIAGGELRATNAAYANLLANAGGVDLTVAGAELTLDYTGTSSPAAQVKTLLDAGYGSGFAAGQLRSSTAAGSRGLGYGDDGSAVTIMATLYGDADLDGDVDFNDFLALQTSFGSGGTRFDQGNFNYDGATDFNDFLALQTNFGQSIFADTAVAVTDAQVAAMTAFGLAAAVPEPATLGLLGIGAIGLLGRKRRVVR